MAQYVHVELEYEPGTGLPRSFNHTPGIEGRLVLHQTAETTLDAVIDILTNLKQGGLRLDGPIEITARKEMQVGGDDGVTFMLDGDKSYLHITAPDPEVVE